MLYADARVQQRKDAASEAATRLRRTSEAPLYYSLYCYSLYCYSLYCFATRFTALLLIRSR